MEQEENNIDKKGKGVKRGNEEMRTNKKRRTNRKMGK